MDLKAKDIFNGDILSKDEIKKHYKLLVLIFVLLFIYIYCGFKAQAQQHHLTEIRKELRDAQYELLTRKSTITNMTRQSSVAKKLREQGSSVQECNEAVIRLK